MEKTPAGMEKTPAACAMDWSIQFEKSFRSQRPGKSVEAIEEMGGRLALWNSEPNLTVAEYRMFDLIPGEDKLFLNSIFLRLVDAFRLGNKEIKASVVKIFLRMKRKKKYGEGVLSKGKLENYVELLSRVKEVFDKGELEERAMALFLFGCWACIVKDCADVCYIVLSSLVTDDVLQVKAALFAAGCLSELSDDFGNVFLEILGTTILSKEKPKGIRLAGGRAFAKMCYSFSLAEKAYKTGLKLLMDSSEDEFSVVMLISLSRIASHWTLLIPSQTELLTLFHSDERSFHLQVTSLRCYCFILGRGVCDVPSTTGTVHKLFSMLQNSELQPTLQLEALRVLYKILLFSLSNIPCMEILDLFQKLFIVVKNVQQSYIESTRVLAIRYLADLSGKVLGRPDMISGGAGRTLALQVISFVLDQILLLVTEKVDIHQTDFSAETEVKSFLNTLFVLVEKHQHLNCLLLNNICLFIDKVMKMLNEVMDIEKIDSSNHEVSEFDSHGKTLLESKIILSLPKIIIACLQNLEETDAEANQVLDVLKLQAENVCRCIYIGSYTCVIYSLILQLHTTYICLRHITEDLDSLSRKARLSWGDLILHLDKFTLVCAKKMFRRDGYWYSYKAGKAAACLGAWSTAAFVFDQLVTVVQSGSCSFWLQSLARFSNSEKQIQRFLLPDQGTSIVPSESDIHELKINALKTNYCYYTDNLIGARDTLLLAEELLAASEMGHALSFQRWFFTLRVKFLNTIIDMLKLLNKLSSIQCTAGFGAFVPFTDSCMEVSSRMTKLAQEFDLLLTSFMGMGRQSVMGVSALALSCSLVAFTAGFAFLAPKLRYSEINKVSKSGNLEEAFYALLIEDLGGRLRHIDCKTRENLLFILKSFRNCNSCYLPRFKTQNFYSYEAIPLHKLSEYSIGKIFSLQNEAIRVERDSNAFYQIINSGSQLLMNVISKVLLTPFRTPHYFFRVRSSVSSELFVMNEDGQNVDGSSLLSGLPLSLNLSFQLKNVPAGLPGSLNKVHCILKCKPHSHKDDEIDDMVDLNEMLLKYVVGSVETDGWHCRNQDYDCSMVIKYICFELNERHQGFSTCFLDVSSLPMGTYRIRWHSGCIDSRGFYWSLLPAHTGPLFTVHDATAV